MPEALPLVASIGGSVIGGLFGSSSADKAAKAQEQSAQLQQQRFEETRNDLAPFKQTGQNALTMYGNATGANGPGAQNAYYANFQNDPGFQSGVNYGLQGIQRSMAAQNKGGLNGNELTSLMDYGQNAMYNQYHTRLDDLFRAGQLGENAAAQTGMIGNSSAQAQGNFNATAGQYQGAGINQVGQGIATGVNNLANYYYKNPNVFGGSGSSGSGGNDLLGADFG